MSRIVAIGMLGLATVAAGELNPRRIERAREHWAFRAPVAPVIEGHGHPVDELLARGHRAAGLEPVGEAPREVLLRRAWHVLTGLQPDADARHRWLADLRPSAEWLAAVVGEALASPHFGERWARHWLDVARYADTKGYHFQGGRRYPYAFTYRDWVIRSLNEDLPYDEFVRRQLAADLMDLPDRELAALGFITVGRRFLDKNDLIIADRIDVTFRGTMALTMACVRCHDHKDDPLVSADYYGIYGIFDSIREPGDAQLPVISRPDEASPGYRGFIDELTKRANAAHDFAAAKIDGYQRPPDPLAFDRAAATAKLNQSERGQYQNLIAKMAELEADSEHAPARAMVVQDLPEPREPVIFERGQPGNRGPQVPRAFPVFFREDPEAVYNSGSGRLELARDLTRPGNPLTARVAANRTWMHLMGEPLVSSPGDFGMQTPEPPQRELLDHLAVFLAEHGWSIKALVRHIMGSEAWRRDSGSNQSIDGRDPGNIYYARSNRHRKDLEAWRDTVLQASGRLDRGVGGRPVAIHAPPYPPRRTIYGMIERQNPPSFYRVFDFPESNQPVVRRALTTTPNQALYLMNSPFLHGEAKAAVAAIGDEGDAGKRVEALYQRILGRAPAGAELERALEFLATAGEPDGQAAGAWSYGRGRFVEHQGQVGFEPLPHFTGGAWQGGPILPDAGAGWVHWTAAGGHPGGPGNAAILRWIAPAPASVAIEGRIERPAKEGDGIRALVVSKGRLLGAWEVGPQGKVAAAVPPFEVQAGDRVDFIVECRGDEGWDGFRWAPVIKEAGENLPLAEAGPGFSGPALRCWPQLAQVLMISNEFFFVD